MIGILIASMTKIAASQFKAKCLIIVNRVQKIGKSVVITRGGKPVAQLSPVPCQLEIDVFDYMAGKVKIVGDIVSPIDAGWKNGKTG
jgi:antitoxin (DNA-binding transcriptional repressor) of toxin-antitoxin stability system